MISTCMEEWGILNKVAAIVTDNGANMVKAVRDFLFLEHHPCAAHTLNLCVSDALKKVVVLRETIEKSRKIVGFFKHSVVAADNLEKYQLSLGSSVLKPKQDVATRWNSQFYMLQRLLEIRISLTHVLSTFPSAPENLDTNEWEIISDAVKILEPFEAITRELSGEKFVTASLIIPLIEGCVYALNLLDFKTDICRNLKDIFIHEIIPNRFNFMYTKTKILMATAMDPRFKLSAIEKTEHRDSARELLVNELDSIIEDSESNSVTNTSNSSTAAQSSSTIWQRFEKRKREHNTTVSINQTAEHILDKFFELHLEERAVDPLLWWETKANVMPYLYKLSRKVLMIPATSVPSERLFSKAGQLCNDRRNRLTPKHINEILFLNSNL